MTTRPEGWFYDEAGPWKYKDPDATLDYSFDWTDWLNGDTIASYVITLSGVDRVDDVRNGAVVTAIVSGGAVGAMATVTCSIVTLSQRREDRSFRLKIAQR